MKIFQKMLNIITYQENLDPEGFILRETSDDKKKDGDGESGKEREGKDSKGKDGRGKDSEGADGKGKHSEGEDGKGKHSEGEDGKGKDSKGKDSEGKDGEDKDHKGKDMEGTDRQGNEQIEKSTNKQQAGDGNDQPPGDEVGIKPGKAQEANKGQKENNGQDENKEGPRRVRRPIPLNQMKGGGRRGGNNGNNTDGKSNKERGGKVSPLERNNADLPLSPSLKENMGILKKLYGMPENKDIVIRDIVLGTVPPMKAFALFLEGMTDKTVQDFLFQAIMLLTGEIPPKQGYTGKEDALVNYIKERLLPGSQVTVHKTFREVLDAVNFGETALFLEGSNCALTMETKGFPTRGVERPIIEQLIRGPQEGFGENLRSNTALIRKKVRTENLTTELMHLGTLSRTDVAIMYIKGLANPTLVAEIKRRIKSIKTDYISDSGILEQFIEDSPYNPSPQVLATERPDRVAAALTDGRVAIIIDGNPFVLVVPTTMYELLHTGEENYLRWQYGTFTRYIRTMAFYFALLLPGFYLAVVLYHHEMIPTELLLAIAGNRERVPFPSVVEVLLMEFSFELIREGSLRLPGIMGSTIGIVGALILGQAAVQANIVSPILVILVGVTGLANFAIPNYSLSFAIRIYRFMYIALGSILGIFGLTLGLAMQILLTANLKSFGVPYLSPSGPRTESGTDVVTRWPVFFNEKRPDYINPLDITRQPEISRGWVKDKGGGQDD